MMVSISDRRLRPWLFALMAAFVPYAAAQQDENAKAAALFEALFKAEIDRSPIFQGYLGIKDNNDQWDDISEAFEQETHEFTKRQLRQLRTLKVDKLDAETLLSYRLYEKKLSDDIDGFQWRHHNYPVNQMFGVHSMVPSFLINIHQVADKRDAKAYISRLTKLDVLFTQLIDGLELRKNKNIIPPKFVFAHVLRDSANVITGYPFSEGEDSALLADFKQKVAALKLDGNKQKKLVREAQQVLTEKVGPAYKKLIAYLEQLETHADTRDGIWKLPQGEGFYRHALEETTTTKLSADEIHHIGLREVARIQDKMRDVMKAVQFKGSLKDFFVFMREDEQFYYPQTAEGKQQYLAEATRIIDAMKANLDRLFIVRPQADLVVKAVEPFREKSAGKAFYQRPAADGSRPGTYYANLYDMSDMPIYQMEALAYHEGVPGHHMQLSIAQEIEKMPTFRKFAQYTAYAEGWGLYSEYVPKELGFYRDPYSDFGRLAMELWRACRLVVDTGIHAKKWTRERAIAYLIDNTPNPENDSVKAIERYIVMPSQATAYTIGMLKLLELRGRAEKSLGERYDIREFHDVVLKNGSVPLDVLETLVDEWIVAKQA